MSSLRTTLLAAGLVLAPAFCLAAEPAPPPPPAEMGHSMMHEKEEGGHMHGKRCHMGEHGQMGMMPHPGSMVAIPMLPPGNEKLQVQMQGEIQQKVGEIISKYAGQVH